MGHRKIIQSFVSFGFMAVLAAWASDNEPAEVLAGERSESAASKWGNYNGEPVTKWNADGRTMTLLTELRYTDPQGCVLISSIGAFICGGDITRPICCIMVGH